MTTEIKSAGWIGVGVMGLSMCRRLMGHGISLQVYNRTAAKADPLVAEGARWRNGPSAMAEDCQTIFTMLGFPADVADVYLGANGLLAAIRPGTTLIDMTTTKPSLAEKIQKEAARKRAFFIDAPVSGGDVGAREGALSIMVGGDSDSVARVRPLFEIMGKNIIHQGPAGAGQHTKMCNQIAIAGTMIGVCESLLYGARAGLDLNTMLASIRSGAAGCWTLEQLAPRILKRNFDPGFYIDHFIKDMEIALEEAARMDLALPGLALVNQLYRSVKAQGHGRRGTHALILGLERMAGLPSD